MTTGHKHRTVKVKYNGLMMRALSYRLLTTTDLERVDASPYPYGPVHPEIFARHPELAQPFYLSILSVLHRWTGLTLEYDKPEEKDDERAADRR